MMITFCNVQSRFLSIITDLTTNPELLSQFSIWVDLRIAEFKTKGQISLEVDGKTLEPAWLCGHRPNKDGVYVNHDLHNSSDQCLASDQTVVCGHQSDNSPEGIKMLTIPVDQKVVPIRLHRKRGIQQMTSDSSVDPDKTQESSTWLTTNPNDVCSATADMISQSLDLPFAESIGSDKKDPMLISPQFTVVSKFQQYVPKNMSTSYPSSSGNSPTSASVSASISPRKKRLGGCSELYPVNFPERLSNNVIKTRICGWQEKPHNAILNMVSAVGTVERWWWSKYNENRNIESLSPEELDDYLTEFYPILQKPNGSDYTADSMSNFRCSLERFLKELKYPCSITKSQEFVKSRQVFKERRRLLATERFELDKRCIQEEWSNTGQLVLKDGLLK